MLFLLLALKNISLLIFTIYLLQDTMLSCKFPSRTAPEIEKKTSNKGYLLSRIDREVLKFKRNGQKLQFLTSTEIHKI